MHLLHSYTLLPNSVLQKKKKKLQIIYTPLFLQLPFIVSLKQGGGLLRELSTIAIYYLSG